MPRAGGIQKGGAHHFRFIAGCEKSGSIRAERLMFGTGERAQGSKGNPVEECGSANDGSDRINRTRTLLYLRLLSLKMVETGSI